MLRGCQRAAGNLMGELGDRVREGFLEEVTLSQTLRNICEIFAWGVQCAEVEEAGNIWRNFKLGVGGQDCDLGQGFKIFTY